MVIQAVTQFDYYYTSQSLILLKKQNQTNHFLLPELPAREKNITNM